MKTNIKSKKNNIRKEIEEILPINKSEKDIKIKKNLLSLEEIKNAEKIFCYQSLNDEVSTQQIVNILKNKIILAHKDDKPLNPVNANIIIVPGRAFDIKGNRLGRGSGHYDKFLAETNALKIALAYESQIRKIPVEKHDQKVDIIITEKRIIKCN